MHQSSPKTLDPKTPNPWLRFGVNGVCSGGPVPYVHSLRPGSVQSVDLATLPKLDYQHDKQPWLQSFFQGIRCNSEGKTVIRGEDQSTARDAPMEKSNITADWDQITR